MTLDEYVQGELMAYIQIILDSCVPVGEESSNMDEEDLRQRLFELEKVSGIQTSSIESFSRNWL